MCHLNPGKDKFIGLISSVPSEGELLVKKLRNIRKNFKNNLIFYRGKLLDKNVVYTVSGIGKTNSSYALTILIQQYNPALIINFGVGGTYPASGLKVGDIAVAEREVYGDEGVIDRNGFHGTEFIGIPILKKDRKRYFNEFKLDRRLTRMATKSSKFLFHQKLPNPEVKSGTFVTVSSCTGTYKRASELRKRFNAICENMEGAAVAHICCLYGIPCVEIRGISNIVEDRDTKKWNIKLASENCQKAVSEFINIL